MSETSEGRAGKRSTYKMNRRPVLTHTLPQGRGGGGFCKVWGGGWGEGEGENVVAACYTPQRKVVKKEKREARVPVEVSKGV